VSVDHPSRLIATMPRRLEDVFESDQGTDWFSIPVFFVLMRETLEIMVVLACMFAALEKIGLEEEKKWISRGAALGVVVDAVIGAALVAAFYSLRKNAFDSEESSEKVFEGTLMLFAAMVVTVFALGLHKFLHGFSDKMQRKMKKFNDAFAGTVVKDLPHDPEGEEEGEGEEEDEDDEGENAEQVVMTEADIVLPLGTVATSGAVAASGGSSSKKRKPRAFRAHKRRDRRLPEQPPALPTAAPVVVSKPSEEEGTAAISDRARSVSKLRRGLFFMAFIAVVREGLECIVFLAGLTSSYSATSMILPAISGILVGLVLGYFFVRSSRQTGMAYFVYISIFMLFCIGAGLVTRAFSEFQELGLEGGEPMFDISECCSQHTPFWGFLRIIFGYNASPTPVEFFTYWGYWAVALSLAWSWGFFAKAPVIAAEPVESEEEQALGVQV